MAERRTYEEGYKKGYEEALFSVIKAIIDLAEDDNFKNDQETNSN